MAERVNEEGMSPPPPTLRKAEVHSFLVKIFADDFHAKRVLSLTDGTLGVLQTASLGVRAIGQGLALAKGLDPRHAIKQIDRLLSNEGIDNDEAQELWVKYRLQGATRVDVIADWTHFDKDDHATLMLSLRTGKGRAEPLLWRTYPKSTLKGNQSQYEDEMFKVLQEILPPGVHVTIVADRGFFDHALLRFLAQELGFGYVIRLRGNIRIESEKGEVKPAVGWVLPTGKPHRLRHARVTGERLEVGAVVTVKGEEMEKPWVLVCSDPEAKAADVIALYGQRFTCEELFRDIKDLRFGMGMKWGKITDPRRRDRMLLLATLAYHLLTLLGEAGERCGIG